MERIYRDAAKTRAVPGETTPQSEPIPGEEQVQNDAGGYVYAAGDWARLRRFLILGSADGTYYVNPVDFTKQNVEAIRNCIAEDGARVVREAVAVSNGGLAPKNDPAIFVLSMCAAAKDVATRQAAAAALPEVCRIPTHLFQYVEYLKGQRGWGHGMRKAVGEWFLRLGRQGGDKLAYECLKYQQREGWSIKDLLRKSHVVPDRETTEAVFRYLSKTPTVEPPDDGKLHTYIMKDGQRSVARKVKDGAKVRTYRAIDESILPRIVEGFERAKTVTVPAEAAMLIREYGLTREMVPSEVLDSPEVWDALLEKMPVHAMVRNLGKMSKVGLLKPFSVGTRTVVERLGDTELIRKSRLHPFAILLASKVYGSGRGVRGSNTWEVVTAITDALDVAYGLAFMNVKETGKRIVCAIDVSGSMAGPPWTTWVQGIDGFSPREAAAAMALVHARTEKNVQFIGFHTNIEPCDLGRRASINEAVRYLEKMPSGGTDCAQPAIWLEKKKIEADALILYTDNETWAGNIHASQALARYRKNVNAHLRVSCVSMTATDHTLNAPYDALSMDVVGMDASTPAIINDFIRG